MSETRPIGEQLRFASSKTGTHILDAYLEAAERGDRTLADILSDLWDGATGLFRTDLVQFRVAANGAFEQRIGDWPSPSLGWTPVANAFIFRPRGTYATATAYERLDVVSHLGDAFVCDVAHTSSTPAPGPNFRLLLTGGGVPTNRTIATSTGLTGGGDLSANRTLALDLAFTDGRYSLASHVHANATTSVAGFLSAADKSKLDAIQANATANATDAQLRDRATHTGTQPASTITGLAAIATSASASDLTAGTISDARLPSRLSTAGAFTSLTVAGSAVWHAGNFTPSSYALLSGATFTGATIFSGSVALNGNFANWTTAGWTVPARLQEGRALQWNGAGNHWGVGVTGDAFYVIRSTTNDATQAPSYPLTITPTGVAIAGSLSIGGSAVWHAGNLNPANYALLAGTADISITRASPRITLNKTDAASNSAIIGQLNGVQRWTIEPLQATTQDFVVARSNASGLFQDVPLALRASDGAMFTRGNEVWHAGNLNPANYAPLAGSSTQVFAVATPTLGTHAVSRDVGDGRYARLVGATFTGGVTVNGNFGAWTTAGWGVSQRLQTSHALQLNTSGGVTYGIGQSGDGFFVIRGSDNTAGASVTYPLIVSTTGGTINGATIWTTANLFPSLYFLSGSAWDAVGSTVVALNNSVGPMSRGTSYAGSSLITGSFPGTWLCLGEALLGDTTVGVGASGLFRRIA